MSQRMEKHHMLFNRYAWTANPDLTQLRSDRRLIVPLEHDTHQDLHHNISHVPPVSFHLARRVLRMFEEFGDDGYSTNIENLQRSIETASKDPRADQLEREVAELASYSLDLQKNYIEN